LLDFWSLPILRTSKQLENTTFLRMDLLPCLGVGKESSALLGPLEKANHSHNLYRGLKRVGAYLHSPEESNRSSFRKVVVSSYFHFQTMDRVHKSIYLLRKLANVISWTHTLLIACTTGQILRL
jgi:hypothetical protein